MVKVSVKLGGVKEVDAFNKICSRFSCDVDLQAGKYYVDAKSIMGIFSLDLDKPLMLVVNTEDEADVKEKFKAYLAE